MTYNMSRSDKLRKKIISKTYLKDVNKYNLKICFDNNDYYIVSKKIIDISEPFILPDGRCLINNGYYIIELLPIKENYAMRVFFNDKKERLEYYFDITKENGMDELSNIPYYDDLYLDVTVRDNNIKILDEDELIDALNNKAITKEEYNLAIETKDKLIESIKSKSNRYMKIDLEQYLN